MMIAAEGRYQIWRDRETGETATTETMAAKDFIGVNRGGTRATTSRRKQGGIIGSIGGGTSFALGKNQQQQHQCRAVTATAR